jgi:restriction system protein
MPIPDFQSCMLPLLRAVSNRAIFSAGEIEHILAVHFGLTEHELSELLPSGRQRIFRNRVAWAKSYLKQAGLLESPKRGLSQVTDRGVSFLGTNPSV